MVPVTVVLPRQQRVDIIEHGWCCVETILHPSLVLVEPPTQLAFYFSGMQLTRDDLLDLLPGKVLPLVACASYGRDGMGHQGYRQAYENAWAYARKLAQERNIPLKSITVVGRTPAVEVTRIYV